MAGKATNSELLEKIYILQQESAVSDEKIKKDVAIVQEKVTSVTQDVTELKDRMSKQDDILARLVDQSYQMTQLSERVEQNTQSIKAVDHRVTVLERLPANTALQESNKVKAEKAKIKNNVRDTVIQVSVTILVSLFIGFVLGKFGIHITK